MCSSQAVFPSNQEDYTIKALERIAVVMPEAFAQESRVSPERLDNGSRNPEAMRVLSNGFLLLLRNIL